MPASFPVPIQEDIRDLLVDLLGRGTAVDKVPTLELEEDAPALIAEYVTDEGATGALCIVDGALAVRAGAALCMVPANVAEESVKRDEMPDHLVENFREIVNILARLLNSSRTAHLRLADVHPLPGELPAGVSSLRDRPEFRRDFAVHIDGYGQGRLSLLVN
jgi:hypothetical protein